MILGIFFLFMTTIFLSTLHKSKKFLAMGLDFLKVRHIINCYPV